MPTLIETRQQIEQNHLRDYENYVASTRANEVTFAGEALDAHIYRELTYEYRDGELWSEHNQPLSKIFNDSVDYYRRKANVDPSLEFQYRRSLTERRELYDMLAMFQGGPNTIVAKSTYPSELEGAMEDIEGYQWKRQLGFSRVITRISESAVKMRTHSFDGNNARGIEAMYSLFGCQVDWNRDVLEQTVKVQIDDPEKQDQLLNEILGAYDNSLSQTKGGKWFAGRLLNDKTEANTFVESQTDLLDQHVRSIIHAGPNSEEANQLRYNFVSALRRRYSGNQAVGGSVVAEMLNAGSDARASGETVSGCGLTISTTTESQLLESGYQIGKKRREWKWGNCQVCLRDGMVGECAVCRNCEEIDNRGGNLLAIQAKARAAQAKKVGMQALHSATERSTPITKLDLVRRQYGEYAAIRQEIVIGGAHHVVYDRRTNEEITRY